MIRLELLGVRVELPSNAPVMLLAEVEGRRRKLSIFIGGPEAAAIAFALEGVEAPRPLTHDLFVDVIAALSSKMVRVVLTELRDKTFYAVVHLTAPGSDDEDAPVELSARPSDAVALAVRSGCPIFASEELLDEAGFIEEESESDEAPEDVVEEFREFIQNVSPEDFAS